jgi:SAM-dependent methyltransferase
MLDRQSLARRARRVVPGRPQMGWRRTPVSRWWGYDRGTPVDRHYLDQWLRAHGADIRGRVLDVGDDTHATRYGGSAVERIDVLHPTPGTPGATVVGDLETGEGMPRDTFDTFLLLETLQVLYALERAVEHAFHAVRPGGVVLATANGVSRLDLDWVDYWRFTSASMGRLFSERFGEENVATTTYGNVLSSSAYLYGLAAEELSRKALDHRDERFQVLIAVRAQRPATG